MTDARDAETVAEPLMPKCECGHPYDDHQPIEFCVSDGCDCPGYYPEPFGMWALLGKPELERTDD